MIVKSSGYIKRQNYEIIITVKTGKGLNSTKKEIDKTVDAVLMIGELINKKLKGIREGKCKIYPDGTSLLLLCNY